MSKFNTVVNKVIEKSDKEATIEDIALKLNLKRKGNLPDIERTSRRILQDWLNGRKSYNL